MSKNEVRTLLLILILAFGLRLSGIGFESLWLDETYQSLIEAYGHPAPDLAAFGDKPFLFQYANPVDTKALLENFSKVDEVCPPLYGVMLNAWIRMLGGSDIAIRLLSCLISFAGVGAVYFISRSMLNPQAALFASLLMTVSPFDIAYGQEARMYSLAELASVLSFGSMMILCRWKEKRLPIWPLLVYVISTWALVNSHYTALFIALAGGLWGMSQVVLKRSVRLFAILSVGWLAIVLLWLPWLGFFLAASAVRKKSLYVVRAATWWWPFYALLAKVPINWLSFLSGRRVVLPLVPMYATSASFLFLALRKTFDPERLNAMLALWFWVLLPAVGIWTTDVLEGHRIIEVSRYLIGTAPAIYILCGAGLASVTTRHKFWLYLFLCHITLAMANNVYQHIVLQKEPWRQMAQLVETNVNDDTLFVCQPYDIICLDRYLHTPRKQVALSTVMTDEQLLNAIAKYDKFWLVTALDGEAIAARMPAHLAKKQEFKLSRGLFLRFYEVEQQRE